MVFFSDSHETVSHFAACIDELQDLFRRSAVDFGAPEDLVGFARRLKGDGQLREDLTTVAKSIMERENPISLRTILTIIALASAGPGIATSDQEMSAPVNQLIDFLIGVGGCSQINAESLYSPPPKGPSDPTGQDGQIAIANTSLSAELSLQQTGIHQQSPASEESAIETTAFSSDPAPANDSAPSNTLTESLTRLELSTLEVKLYLDSIDQRISRMEPRLENVPAFLMSAAAQSAQPPPDEATHSEAAISETETRQPRPQSEAAKKRPEASSPLWTKYSHPFSSSRLTSPILLTLAAVFLLGFLYWAVGRDTPQPGVPPAIQPLDADIGGSPAATASRPTATATNSSANTYPSPPAEAATQPSSHRVAPGSLPTDAPASTQPITLTPHSASTDSPSDIATSTSDTIAPAASSRRSYPSSATRSFRRPVNVSSGVMTASLLSAPEPSYPRLASLTHLQGQVVMQAIISKGGTVESLRVLKGHFLLRSAATKAVRTWRFRPYLIAGTPVEVATIVSVDFNQRH